MEITENLHIGVIYMFTNKINGKKYIGQTINERRRYSEHISKTNEVIDKAIKKYGIGSFNYEILDTIIASSKEGLIHQLNRWEVYYINKYNTTDKKLGYNLDHGSLNKVISIETRKKMSASHKGKKLSEECIKKLKARKGFKHSEETRKKLSEAMKEYYKTHTVSKENREKARIRLNKMWSDEKFRKNRSERYKGKNNPFFGKTFSEKELEKRRKKILQCTLNGELIKEWNSIKEASTTLKLDNSSICACCRGKQKTCGGFKWKYKEKEGTN